MTTATRVTVVAGLAALVSIAPLMELTAEITWIMHAGLAVLLVTVTGHLARRLRTPIPLTIVLQLAVLGWWLGLLIAADLAWLGFLPSAEWPARFDAVFRDGAEAINVFATPVPVTNGILVYLVGGAGAVAIMVDLLASGVKRAVLTGLPLAACYTVTAGIEGGDIGWWWFVLPAVGYLSVLITESRSRVSAWGRSASHAARNGMPRSDALARNGRRVGAVALIAAVAIPAVAPVLSNGLVNGRGGGGGGGDGRTIRTDNPILDLQRNLNRPDNVEVLRYRPSDESPHYIRTVTLDSFDGEVWQTSDRPVPESQRVSEGLPEPPGMDLEDPPEVEFEFEITDNYSSRWLPLAYPAQEIDIVGDWRYDISTLDVVSTDDDVLGTEYTATSLQISADAEMLQDAAEPDSDVSEMTDLPDELPRIVTDLADEVTRDADDDFSRAAALQQWFRSSEFTYDITTQPGTSAHALADFLTDRRGYCEQFAASMAIMARHLGIPARVAVGFTAGTFEGDDTWLIRAHDAHAWPELYFEGVGWIMFEPTPAGRTGSPPAWTIQPQVSEPDTNTPTPGSTSTAAPADNPDALPDEEMLGGAGGAAPSVPSAWPWAAAAGVIGVAALASVPVCLAQLRRWRRWQRAGDDPVAMAAASWSDISEAVRDAGLPWDPAATPRVMGRKVSSGADLTDADRALLDHLVAVTERARYARRAGGVPRLREDTGRFCRAMIRSRSRGRRVRAVLWPASLSDAWYAAGRSLGSALDRLDATGVRMRAAFARGVRR